MLFEATNHCSLSPSCVCDIPSECPAGMFGLGCRHRCQCDNKALCDHVSGACTCQVGWTGTFCEKRKWSFLITKPNSPSEYVYMLLTGSLSLYVFQRVLRVSSGWTARRSVCVWMVGAAMPSVEFAPVPPAGSVPSATSVSDRCMTESSESSQGLESLLVMKERWNQRPRCLYQVFV